MNGKKVILLVCLFGFISLSVNALQLPTVVYVSSSQGNNSNNGHSADAPLASISKALAMADTIYLKAGDTFYGNVDFSGKYVTRYGEGANPVICGFKRIVKPAWVQVEDNIWKISLKEDCFTGVNVTDYSLNNIGCIYDYENNRVYGRKVQYKNELTEDWDFWQTECFAKTDVKEDSFDWLYLRLKENPNKMKLEFSIGVTGVKLVNGKVSHLHIRGFGRHGIGAGSNVEISDCKIDIIGGCIQIGYNHFVRLGNGIEFYVYQNVANCLVQRCEVSRCYDCGITIQGSGRKQAAPSDILIEYNYIHDCCQGWEDFLRNGKEDVFNNCVFQHNLVVNNGNRSAFGYEKSRFKFCQVLGNNMIGNKGMIIRNNLFINGNYYCSGAYQNRYASNVWIDNTCYMLRGQFLLGNYTGTKDVIRIPVDKGDFNSIEEATEDAIARYRELTGDETTRFIVVDEKKMKKITKSALKRWGE